jgi:hypothetical protein
MEPTIFKEYNKLQSHVVRERWGGSIINATIDSFLDYLLKHIICRKEAGDTNKLYLLFTNRQIKLFVFPVT